VLLVGLGGGTQVHLLYRLSDPRSITVIERDPVIVRVARQWFGLDRVGKLEMVCADAETAIAGLARMGRRFDYVMEDVTYADPPEVALPKLLAIVPLVTPLGRSSSIAIGAATRGRSPARCVSTSARCGFGGYGRPARTR
jgi:protein-L-isoaspartate O-methyltransferase